MIYLDHNATSPVREEVVEQIIPYFREFSGNPSSVHNPGRAAQKGLDDARRKVAGLVDVHASQVIFTSGGTEANNLALMGVASKFDFKGRIITSTIEHPSVLQMCDLLESRGMQIVKIGVDEQGVVDLDSLEAAITPDTCLISIMHANNETGVVQPVADIANICRHRDVLFHSDTVQSVAKLPVTLANIGADMISLSAHKFGGPKGVGALIINNRLKFPGILLGGSQERGRRAGTENLPGIVGFGAAADLLIDGQKDYADFLFGLRNQLEEKLSNLVPELVIFGNNSERLANTTAVGIAGLDGETLVMHMDMAGFAISAGSACGSGRTKASHVLTAMGYDGAIGQSAVRISLGWDTKAADIDKFVMVFSRTVKQLQQMSAPLTMAV
ncbi:MAG: cysteine desulfurase [Magnetococcales bacterium]|nr:cysteine desulfurase [Magnetococcales bacterium]